jgi:drug/metabolite transporter (DMT)-like permease
VTAPDITQPQRSRRRTLVLAFGLMIVGGLIWGLTFSLAKLVTGAGVHPIGLSWLQGAVGVVALLPYCLIRYGGLPLRRDYLELYIIAGALGTALPSNFLFLSASHLPAGVLAMVTSLVPLLTYGIAIVFGAELFRRRRVVGIVLGFVAVMMIILPEASLPEPAMAVWVLIALIAPISYSSENVYLALRRPPASDPIILLCGMLIAGTIMLTPLVWYTDTWVELWRPWTEIEWWTMLLIAINVAGYLMFLELIVIAGPLFAAQTGYFVTASGVVFGIIIFGEQHSAWIWVALGVLFTGVALVNPRAAENRESPIDETG